MRSQKDGKAGKNLKVTGVVHVLLVQVDTNLCSQYSIYITYLAKRYTHYIIFCVRLEVFLPWMAEPVVILIARLSSFLSILMFLFLSCFLSLHCFPLPLETHNAILQGDPGKRKAQEQDNQQHVKSQMEGGDGPELVKFYQHQKVKGSSLQLPGMRSLTTSSTSRCSTTTRWARTTGWVGWRLTWGSWVERWTIVEFYIFGQFCMVQFYVLGLPCCITSAILFLRWATTFGGRSRKARASSMWSSPSAEPQRFFIWKWILLQILERSGQLALKPGQLEPSSQMGARSWGTLREFNCQKQTNYCLTRIH